MQLNLKVLQLLSSRLCHDIVGPAGAIQNGIELFEEMGSEEDEGALEVIATSSEKLLARIAFFRLTFGQGGPNGRKSPLAEARELAQAYLKGSRVSLDWPPEMAESLEKKITVIAIKILLNMILVAIDAIPRGGSLEVSVSTEDEIHKGQAVNLVVRAIGRGAFLSEDLQCALLSEKSSHADLNLSAQNIHGFFCQRLAENQLSKVSVFTDRDEVRFTVLLPQCPK